MSKAYIKNNSERTALEYPVLADDADGIGIPGDERKFHFTQFTELELK